MICLDNDKLIVQGYQKILKVNEDEIVFMIYKKTIVVLGNNLSLPFFENDEFILKGKIEKRHKQKTCNNTSTAVLLRMICILRGDQIARWYV